VDKGDIGDAVAFPVLSVLCRCLKPLEVSTCGVDTAIETAPDNEVRSAVVGEIVRGDSDVSATLIGHEVSFPVGCLVPSDNGFACRASNDVELPVTVYISDCEPVNAFEGVVQ
jgi:hypothetical protein